MKDILGSKWNQHRIVLDRVISYLSTAEICDIFDEEARFQNVSEDMSNEFTRYPSSTLNLRLNGNTILGKQKESARSRCFCQRYDMDKPKFNCPRAVPLMHQDELPQRLICGALFSSLRRILMNTTICGVQQNGVANTPTVSCATLAARACRSLFRR